MIHDTLNGKYLQSRNIFRFVCTALLFSLLILTFVSQGAASTLAVEDSSNSLVTNVFMSASEKGADAACSMAPVNPKFVEYQTQMNTHGMSSSAHGMGYAPSPVDLSHIKGSSTTYAESSSDYDSYFADLSDSSYDLREYEKVTSVKNQGAVGTCWAHATYAALESYLLLGTDTPEDTPDIPVTPDFSENNMKNLLNNWDETPYLECFDFDDGGNSFMSAAYLTRWSGPIDEVDDPYTTTFGISPECSEQKHVQEVLWIDSDITSIKDAVVTYGAVQTSFYWDGAYYNEDNDAYYYPGSSYSNHAVAIVGWDDEFTSPNFPEPGAYIIKNSWGTGWGEDGYFYMSYYDAHAADDATIFTAEESNNYDNIYQYDPLGWVTSMGYGSSTAWAANMFTVKADETLEAVSFYTTDTNTHYDIYVYLDPSSGPISSNLVATKEGTCSEVGYHTVSLDSRIDISSGQEFSVVIKFETSGYTYPIAIERPYPTYSSKATATRGESYISYDGNSWKDISVKDINACIKAFTSDVSGNDDNDPPVLDPIADLTVYELDTLTFTATASDNTPGDTLTFSLVDAPTGASITADGDFSWTPTEEQGYEEQGSTEYTFSVKVTDAGGNSDDKVIKVTVNEVNVAPELDLIVEQSVEVGTELTFTATANDADIPVNTLTFSLVGTVPDGASIDSNSGDFTWKPTETGTYTVYIVVSDGTYSDSETVTINVVQELYDVSIADFTSDITRGRAPLTVKFEDLSFIDPEISGTTWSWDFGDGETSINQNPEHTYTAAGTYTVSLTVENSAGADTMTKVNYIRVLKSK